MQAAQGQKAHLEGALVSSGPLLKQVVAQRDQLLLNMKKLVADDVTRNLENVYAPILEAYKQKCARLEAQLKAHGLSARPSPAPSGPTPLFQWQPVPEQEVQGAQVSSQCTSQSCSVQHISSGCM